MTYPKNPKKLTARVESEDYERLLGKLHHGFSTHVIRCLVNSLGRKLETEGREELWAWLDGKGNLNLPTPEVENDISDAESEPEPEDE